MSHFSLKGCLPSPGFIIMPVITFSTKRPWCHYFQCVILKNRTNYIKSDDNSPNFDLPSMFWMRSIKLHCEQETLCHLVFIWFWSLSSIAKLVRFYMKGQETSRGECPSSPEPQCSIFCTAGRPISTDYRLLLFAFSNEEQKICTC